MYTLKTIWQYVHLEDDKTIWPRRYELHDEDGMNYVHDEDDIYYDV